jgi:hypothetical protein
MKLLRSIAGFLVLAGATQAATVNLIQTSVNDADGTTIGAVAANQWLETAISYSTVTAPASWSSYRFTHWTINSYPATSYRDAWGRSLNPVSFILLEDTTATAHYLPATRDTDADGLPDWYEIEYFGDLSRTATDDTDGDGIPLLSEYSDGTHPLYGNAQQEGGVSWADSESVTVNLAGFSRYTLSSVPPGTVNQSAIVPDGTPITTPNLTQPTFAYWELDGVRQQDQWGVALRQFTFTVDGADRLAVAHFLADDSDADGINDGFEVYYYDTLANGAASDTDGDGLSLLAEYTGGTSPLYGNSQQEGGVSWTDSAMVTVNLAGFSRYTLSSVPSGIVNQSAIMPDGTPITTPNLTQPTFAYWELDGVRQQDQWGVALRQFTFTVDGADRLAVAHFLADDSDADGINDGFEVYYYDTLANSAASDTDGDGISLLSEYTTGTSPLYGNSQQEGGVSWADSATVVVNLQPVPGKDTMGTVQNTLANAPVFKLLANDSSLFAGPLSITSVISPSDAGGTVSLASGGTMIAYIPRNNFVGVDRFAYTLSDGHFDALGLVTVIVTSANAPSANSISVTPNPGAVFLEFAGLPRRTYIVQSAPSITGPWADVSGVLTASATGLITYNDENPPPIRFYRTRLAP